MAKMSIGLLDAVSIAVVGVAGGLLALVLWPWASVPEGDLAVGDADPWTMRLAAVTLAVWAMVGARLFGLV